MAYRDEHGEDVRKSTGVEDESRAQRILDREVARVERIRRVAEGSRNAPDPFEELLQPSRRGRKPGRVDHWRETVDLPTPEDLIAHTRRLKHLIATVERQAEALEDLQQHAALFERHAYRVEVAAERMERLLDDMIARMARLEVRIGDGPPQAGN